MTIARPASDSFERLAGRSGLEFLRGMLGGTIPPAPIYHVLALRLIGVETGKSVFSGEPRAEFYNPLGAVHGGYMMTLIDTCAGSAVHSTLAPGLLYTTIETKVNFVHAVREGAGPLRAEGLVLSAGSRIATAEARLWDARDRLCAHGTSTCLIFQAT